MSALPQHLILGICLVIAGAFTITVQDAGFKLFAGDLTLWQIFALRGIIAVPLLAAVFLCWHLFAGVSRGASLARAFAPWPFLRAVTFTATLLAFYASIPYLDLSVVGAANYTAPIFIAILSAFVIGERVPALGWAGIGLGFVGLLFLLQPGTDDFSTWVFLPVAGAVFYAVTHLITRLKCQDVPPMAMALSQNFVMMLAGFSVSAAIFAWPPQGAALAEFPELFGQWSQVGRAEWIFLAVMAVLAIAASTMIAGAYQMAPPATVATFEYSYLIFAVFWDTLIDRALPNPLSLLGVALIICAGLLLLRRRRA